MAPQFRTSTRNKKPGHEGVLRDERGRVVWACGHVHARQNNDGQPFGCIVPAEQLRNPAGYAARRCAEAELRRLSIGAAP